MGGAMPEGTRGAACASAAAPDAVARGVSGSGLADIERVMRGAVAVLMLSDTLLYW